MGGAAQATGSWVRLEAGLSLPATQGWRAEPVAQDCHLPPHTSGGAIGLGRCTFCMADTGHKGSPPGSWRRRPVLQGDCHRLSQGKAASMETDGLQEGRGSGGDPPHPHLAISPAHLSPPKPTCAAHLIGQTLHSIKYLAHSPPCGPHCPCPSPWGPPGADGASLSPQPEPPGPG